MATDGGIMVRTAALKSEGPYDVLGHRMWIDKSSPCSLDMVYGAFERDTVEVFQKIVKPGMTVIDVGAHVGFYTLLAARLVGPRGRVYAFEPNPGIFRLLCRNVEENGYQDVVKLFPKAVLDREGKARLYIPQGEKAEASFFSDDRQKWQEVEVETITLDKFFAMEGWPRVDVIKIDVEGSAK